MFVPLHVNCPDGRSNYSQQQSTSQLVPQSQHQLSTALRVPARASLLPHLIHGPLLQVGLQGGLWRIVICSLRWRLLFRSNVIEARGASLVWQPERKRRRSHSAAQPPGCARRRMGQHTSCLSKGQYGKLLPVVLRPVTVPGLNVAHPCTLPRS